MSVVLDIVLVAIVVAFTIIGAKKGFFVMVASFASKILGLLAAILFYKPVAALIKQLPFLSGMVTEVEMPDINTDAGVIDNLKNNLSYILSPDIDDKAEAIVNNLIAEVISIALAFVLLLVGVSLLVKLVFKLLDFVAKMPVLKQVNGLLGAVMGVCTGLFWTWVFALVFEGFLFSMFNANWPEIFTNEMLESVVYKIFTEFNPVAFIANLMQAFI